MNKRKTTTRVVILFLTIALSICYVLVAFAYQVPPLPTGNLIVNPWFRSFTEPTASALDGWTDAAGKDKYWSSSQKESNPSPDIVVSGDCGSKYVYCGTAARLADTPGQSGGLGKPGVDSYLYQIVAADKTLTKLRFFSYWVGHEIDPAEVVIYGANDPQGPWTEVWVPLHVVLDEAPKPKDWTHTDWLEKVLPQGYSFYKVVIHAKLPKEGVVGFKITGIYFAVLDKDATDPPPIPGKAKVYLPSVIR